MKLWDVKSGSALTTLHGFKGSLSTVAWNDNGNWLLTASRDQTCKVTALLPGGASRGSFRHFCPEGLLYSTIGSVVHALRHKVTMGPAASCVADLIVRLCDMPGTQDSTDRLTVAGGQVWDLRTLKEVTTFRGHKKDVVCAAWHPVHEELFVSGAFDGTLLYWLASRSTPQARQCTPCIELCTWVCMPVLR